MGGSNPRPPNGPSTTGNPSGKGRGNNPPKNMCIKRIFFGAKVSHN